MTPRRFPTVVRSTLFAAIFIALFPLAICTAGTESPKRVPDRGESAIKRGEEIFRSSCQACHSLKYSGYAAKMAAADGQRAFGKVPPDLSLMAKARGGGSTGAAYVTALLGGYTDTPEKNTLLPNISMPPPFAKEDPELARKARDVAAFLDYAADPSKRERRGLGLYVLGYMVLLTALLYAVNRRTWKRIGKKSS